MTAPVYTANYILSVSETPIYVGTCVICIDGQTVVRYTATNASTYQGRQIGVTVGQALPGNSVPVVTTGQVAFNLCNVGAGSASLVVAAAGAPQRGNSGDVLAVADKSGSLVLYPSFCGVKVAPNQVSLVATGSGLLHCSSGSVDAAANLGSADQLLVTNHAGTDTTWVSLSGDGTLTNGVLKVTQLQSVPVSSAAPTAGQILVAGTGTTWVPVSLSGDGALASTGALTIVSLSGSSGTTSLKSNLTPSTDNTYGIGTSALRLTAVSALSYKVYNAASDAQPSVNITTQQIALGVGGSTALDIRFRRSAATTVTLDDTAGNAATLAPPANNAGSIGTASLSWQLIISQFFACYHAAGDANPTLLLKDNSVSFGAGGASSQDTRLKRTSASNLQLDDGNNGGATLTNPAGFTINAGTQLNLDVNGSPAITINSTTITAYDSILPANDALQSLGGASARWHVQADTVYASTLSGNSSQASPGLRFASSTVNDPNTLNLVTALTSAQLATPYIILTGTINASWTLQFGSGATGTAGVWLVDVNQIAITSVSLTFQAGASGATASVSTKSTTTNLIVVICDGAGHIAVNA